MKTCKTMILILIFVLCLGGIAIRKNQLRHEALQNQVMIFEEKLYVIALDSEEAIEDMDNVMIKDCRDRLQMLQGDIKIASDESDDEVVKAMYSELDKMIAYYDEMLMVISDVINNPWNIMTGMPDELIDNILQKLEEHGDNYVKYKQELEIETTDYIDYIGEL